MTERVGDMTKRELEHLIDLKTLTPEDVHTVIKEAVHETLTQMGVDTTSPLEMQRDFQHLRDWRTAQEALKQKGAFVMVTIIVTGVASLLWIGFKDFFGR